MDAIESLEQRARALWQAPVRRSVTLPASGLSAGARLARALLPEAGAPGCGVIERRHQVGGSVPEGFRSTMLVVLGDAMVEVEEYDDPAVSTRAVVWATTPARAEELEALLRAVST